MHAVRLAIICLLAVLGTLLSNHVLLQGVDADNDREPVSRLSMAGARAQQFPKEPRTGVSSVCGAKACRCYARAGSATCTFR